MTKTTNGVTTKYVYGLGLIGEESEDGSFGTYHFDSRGSTVAITDENGILTDTFAYDTYGKLIGRTGTRKVIFGYNGRDGVVTENNGLIYMRARYYSPDMRRFLNADILHGDITDSTSLNRYAYVNGNPVQYVDPIGLSRERGNATSKKPVNYHQAVLVSRFDEEGLPIVGHTQLYFLGDNGEWYCTEFTSSGGDNLKEMKGNAKVYWENRVPDVYDSESGTFRDVKGWNYAVLNGNFNESVALAEQFYKEGDFGNYNFCFNNCSDYTDALLDVADIDGMFSQILVGGDSLISIPAIRELETSLCAGLDSGIRSASAALISAGEYAGGSSNFWGQTLIDAGEMINKGSNFIGDKVGAVAGKITATKKAIGNGIVFGFKKVGDWISSWN